MSLATPHTESYDAIVIGAGHNGLVCAAYLARARRRVLVIERRSEVGGAAVTREFSPSFQVSACAHLMDGFDPRILRELRLKRRGFTATARPLPITALSLDGRALALAGEGPRIQSSLAAHAPADAASYATFTKALVRLAQAMRPLLEAAPPSLAGARSNGVAGLADADRRLAGLTPTERRLLADLSMGSLADYLDQTFETPLLKGSLALRAVLGDGLSPRHPGSGLSFLMRRALEERNGQPLTLQPRGGLGAFSKALGAAAAALGVSVRTGVGAGKILLENGRACGVELDNGERVLAPIVVSNADPRETFLSLVPRGTFDTGFMRQAQAIRSEGMTAKVHLALEALPSFRGLSVQELTGRLLIAPSLEALDEARAAAEEGMIADEPIMEVTIPSIYDTTIAPISQHVMSIIVQYTPYKLAEGWDKGRDRLIERVVRTLERYAPDLGEKILAGDLLSPVDLEREFALPQGHWHHGALAPDQSYWLRPVAGAEGYATPLAGLYLCGAGTHPGGGITGLPGRNAAQVILAAERRR